MTKLKESFRPNAPQAFKAFQVDASWYESHWYDQRQPTTRGLLARALAAVSALAGGLARARRVFADLPPEFNPHCGSAEVARARQLLLDDARAPHAQSAQPSGDQSCQQYENNGADRRDDDLVDDLAA